MTRFILAAAAGFMISTAASATPTVRLEGATTAYVSYRDLDLRSDQGRSRLVHRIRVAADMVCPDSNDLTAYSDSKGQCYRAAIASGVSQMNEIVRR
jgi:UrcA family protein